jgi:hypothetical protein
MIPTQRSKISKFSSGWQSGSLPDYESKFQNISNWKLENAQRDLVVSVFQQVIFIVSLR